MAGLTKTPQQNNPVQKLPQTKCQTYPKPIPSQTNQKLHPSPTPKARQGKKKKGKKGIREGGGRQWKKAGVVVEAGEGEMEGCFACCASRQVVGR